MEIYKIIFFFKCWKYENKKDYDLVTDIFLFKFYSFDILKKPINKKYISKRRKQPQKQFSKKFNAFYIIDHLPKKKNQKPHFIFTIISYEKIRNNFLSTI